MLKASALKNLPVFTQSGFKLGRIVDWEIDSETQSILRYQVRRRGLWKRWQEPLLIHRRQVVSLTEKQMIVEDALLKQMDEEKERSLAPRPAPSGVSARRF